MGSAENGARAMAAEPGVHVIRQLPFGHEDVVSLVDQVQAVYADIYGSPDEGPVDAHEFDPPGGAFFVAYVDDEPVAMGGWRFRSDVVAFGREKSAEVKRMYVVPAARGRGLARAMLAHLEDTARAAGADLMVLETGLRQIEAIGLYEASGYTPIPGFGYYRNSPLSRCYARPL